MYWKAWRADLFLGTKEEQFIFGAKNAGRQGREGRAFGLRKELTRMVMRRRSL
jgi:hypothetical protein